MYIYKTILRNLNNIICISASSPDRMRTEIIEKYIFSQTSKKKLSIMNLLNNLIIHKTNIFIALSIK